MEQESKDNTTKSDKQNEMELKSVADSIDEAPSVSFAPSPKRPSTSKPQLTKRVSFTTRKIQRPGSASKFIKEHMHKSSDGLLYEEVSENCHGTLRFHGYDNYSGSESVYVKVPYRIHPIRVWEIMTERWQCPVPNLIIAVTGQSSYESIPPKVKDKFKRGLIKAAATTGKMMKDHVTSCGGSPSIVTLGITSWQAINKNEQLISKTKGHSTPVCIDYDKLESSKQDSTQELDNNHTHFILVDDESKPNDDIGFESKFENFLSGTVQIPGARSESVGSQIPFIRILIDGGLDNLKTAAESVKSNIPVIVLDGSGKAADLVADVYRKADKLSDSDIRGKINKHDLSLDENEAKQCVDIIKTIIKNKAHLQMLNIFHVHEFETKDFDKVILESLLKARESNATAKLLVSLAWNRSDIAEKQIFIPQNRESLKPELKNFMVMALIQNRHEFVRLLTEQGIELESFFNVKNLWNLYANCLMDTSDKAASLLNNLIHYRQHSLSWYRHFLVCFRQVDIWPDHSDLLIAIGDAVEYLLQDEVMNPYPHREFKEYRVNLSSCEMGYIEDDPDEYISDKIPDIVHCMTCSIKRKKKKKKKTKLRDVRLFDGPEMQLFLWALLLNRIEMAKIFWSMLPRIAAVLGGSILKAFNKYAKKEESFDLSESLRNNSRDGEMAQKLLVQRIFIRMLLPILVFDVKFTSNGQVKTKEKPQSQKEEEDDEKKTAQPYLPTRDKTKQRFYRVSLLGDKRTISLGFALYYLYRAPITIFMANIAYLVFLGLFTYFVLTDLRPGSPSVPEYLCYTWILASIFEEMREISFKKQKTVSYKIYKWLANAWNRFDLLLHSFFVLSVILRFTLNAEVFVWARISYSLTLTMAFLRFMELLDLLFFIFILGLFMLGFGTEPASCTTNETLWRYGGATRCSEASPYVMILAVVYMMLTNILLVNLVIAMFSHTFQKVQSDSKKLWRFHRFQLVHGYYIRPMMVPPFIIFTHLFRLFQYFLVKKCKIRRLSLFERDAALEYLHQINTVERQKMETKIDSAVDRIDQSSLHIESLKELIMRNENAQKMQIQSNFDDIKSMKTQINGIENTLNLSYFVFTIHLQYKVLFCDEAMHYILNLYQTVIFNFAMFLLMSLLELFPVAVFIQLLHF
ncbi:hypothetical protein KUTeg_011649 [Tegillarca granosa]|uniref:Uncharacterized protein n=1 Tax=Tegillarca granosa TaxID=220873 RepID=A0ABQ9EX87_TEGGR|nr:hypothetical protein KUTeg_011649 [Tegillarca granosa]